MRLAGILLQLATTAVASAGISHTSYQLSRALVKKVVLLVVALVCGINALVLSVIYALLWLAPVLTAQEVTGLVILLLAAVAIACYMAGRDINTLKALESAPSHGLSSLGNLAEAFKRGWERG